MSSIQTWIGRLSPPALILLHVSGAIIGAALAMILGAIVLAIFNVKNDTGTALIAVTSFLTGAILPSLIFWRARKRYLRSGRPPAMSAETASRSALALDDNTLTSVESPIRKAPDQPVRRQTRNSLRDVAEYNQARRQATIEAPNNGQSSSQYSYEQSNAGNIHTLLKPAPRRWRWWYILSIFLFLIVILGIFLPPISIPIAPSLHLEVTRTGLFSADEDNVAEILNVGSDQITITGISVNDRPDCTKDNASARLLPKALKVGETFLFGGTCRIVRITIETNVGSGTYSFAHE